MRLMTINNEIDIRHDKLKTLSFDQYALNKIEKFFTKSR